MYALLDNKRNSICSMVLKGEKKDRTFQGFTNNSSSKGSTVMFDLSKSVLQL